MWGAVDVLAGYVSHTNVCNCSSLGCKRGGSLEGRRLKTIVECYKVIVKEKERKKERKGGGRGTA